jgi:hypothetical protein
MASLISRYLLKSFRKAVFARSPIYCEPATEKCAPSMYSHAPLLVIGQCSSVLDRYARIRQAAWPMRLWLVWKSGV